MKYNVLIIFIIPLFIISCSRDIKDEVFKKPTTPIILISMDGFRWDYFDKTKTPNFDIACKDYELFLNLIRSFGPEIHFLPTSNTSLDSIYTHDPCIVTNGGVILCNMGKEQRSNEPDDIEKYFRAIQIPILGRIERPGTLEGGDIVWIDERTVAVGE